MTGGEITKTAAGWLSSPLTNVAGRLLWLLLTILMGVIAYQGQSVLQKVEDHEGRLTTIEASRFTAAQGAAISAQVSVLQRAESDNARRLGAIESKLDRLLERMP